MIFFFRFVLCLSCASASWTRLSPGNGMRSYDPPDSLSITTTWQRRFRYICTGVVWQSLLWPVAPERTAAQSHRNCCTLLRLFNLLKNTVSSVGFSVIYICDHIRSVPLTLTLLFIFSPYGCAVALQFNQLIISLSNQSLLMLDNCFPNFILFWQLVM